MSIRVLCCLAALPLLSGCVYIETAGRPPPPSVYYAPYPPPPPPDGTYTPPPDAADSVHRGPVPLNPPRP